MAALDAAMGLSTNRLARELRAPRLGIADCLRSEAAPGGVEPPLLWPRLAGEILSARSTAAGAG